jgi:hypothetical protein
MSVQWSFEKGPVEKKDPPCATCRPPLMPENAPAFIVYDRCGDEWMTGGMDGALIAIPGPSIESALNISMIVDPEERQILFDQVKTIARTIAGEIAEDRAKRREAERANRGN